MNCKGCFLIDDKNIEFRDEQTLREVADEIAKVTREAK